MKAFCRMLKIEGRLNVRDMNMVIFALIMPLVVLVIMGILYGNRPAYDEASFTFMEQSFGALCSISICAGGAMGLPIMISEYRERKILKRLWATPVSPAVLLAAHITVYALYALASMVLTQAVGSLCFGMQLPRRILPFLVSWLLGLVCMLSIGMLVGGLAKNGKQASVIASALYFPMLVFSGATLPYEVMPIWLQKIADITPLTQSIKLMKAASLGESLGSVWLPGALLAAVTLVCVTISLRHFRWE